MKKFARVIVATVALVLCFTLSACGTKYKSKYNAKLMVEEIKTNEASVSFDTFSGTYVIKFQNTGDDRVFISYKAKLAEGDIKVYFDFNDEKLNLFHIATNASLEGKTEAFTRGKTIYVIIESDGDCSEGSFSFAVEKAKE